ncbi:hypothetical protein ACJJTC_017350, partial [Scirpophaga incertulas]
MRRTYRSKKESGNALDHRDVIQGLDEKASVFEAYYIQNIKQTKKELSCIGSSTHYGEPPNKVYKKKYVKRLIKEVEKPVTAIRRTVFLTPDKSLRVNKPQDLFDQLLNSSTQNLKDSPLCGYSTNLRHDAAKTYTRKNNLRNKNINYSSEDSYESDKENSNRSNSQCDVTDIKNYELLIEKVKSEDNNYEDDSINNIVKKLSILNRTEFNNSKGFANENYHLGVKFSPNIMKSPLCSTPYKDKYRGKSIYMFSPIGIEKHKINKKHFVLKEQFDDSLVNVNKNVSYEEYIPPSPIIQLSINKSSKSEKSNKTVSKSEIELTSPSKNVNRHDISVEELSTAQTNHLETSEMVPLGFTGAEENNVQYPEFLNCDTARENNRENSIGIVEKQVALDSVSHRESIREDNTNLNVIECSNYEYDGSNDSSVVVVDNYNDGSECTIELNNKSNITASSDTNHSVSSYDTCHSEETSYNVLNTIKYPVVSLERLNASIVTKYLNNNNRYEFNDSVKTDSVDYNSFDESRLIKTTNITNSEGFVNDMIENLTIEDSYCEHTKDAERVNINTSQDCVNNNAKLNTSTHDDKYVSFVTTRRRIGATKNSIFDLDNSIYSACSTDTDKTVLGNSNNMKIECSFNSNKEEKVPIESDKDSEDIPFNRIEANISNENRISNVTTRQSSRVTRNSVPVSPKFSSFITNNEDFKRGIVLQPGKKWQRSLSIYKRMTMMTDHFDESIIDDDQETKGRKYRQSVISTMEMQDFGGSIHNVSLISQRSSIVSKPSRSTICIVKEANSSRATLSNSTIFEDLKGFLTEDCDDTVVELSKLSIADSDHEITVLEKFHDTSNRIASARDYVLRRCCQADAILFDECYPDTVLKNCHKIGEGVYGEVFLWRAGDGRVRVLKIVPIAGNIKVNGEQQKDFHEIISEIVIAMELSALRTPIDAIQSSFDAGTTIDSLDLHSVENATDVFNEVLAVRCVYGAYPSRLLDLWELYDECKGSENDNPAILPDSQQYIVLELANAGQDLESYEFNNAEQAHALFFQVSLMFNF